MSITKSIFKNHISTKKALLSALALLTLGGGISLIAPQSAEAALFHKNVNQRQYNERQRIYSGVRNGSLTRPEAHRLISQQHKINRVENRFRNDGHLSPAERYKLSMMQRNASHSIYNQKHDYQHRY